VERPAVPGSARESADLVDILESLAAQPIAMEAGEEPRRDRSVALAERTYIVSAVDSEIVVKMGIPYRSRGRAV
jgi:hypothetical protein